MNELNEELPRWLSARLAEPLPGPLIGTRFEPNPRPWPVEELTPVDARLAAVLLLLYPHENRWHLPLTLRPATMAAHAGQVSLPGGAVEPDETTFQAALREFHEELGDRDVAIDPLGTLSPLHIRVSNYLVTPWVAVTRSRPRFEPNPLEVEEVLEVPLSHLLDPAHFGHHERQLHGRTYLAPHFLYESHRIWGATCMILGELVTILERWLIDDC